ncbi:MAG: TetR/AcrR family transcriptional regulator [Prevotellaceae bacterium]|jgi:AcrR family transcriptional regulator|nr:TetR/AcrR family transcriptional regulator [Prevotellaceae bacterium]
MGEKDTGTEQDILGAAEEVFIKKGYAATKTTEIAKLAGINHAMLHYYFRTKENLFNVVFQKKVKLMADSFFLVAQEKKPFLEIVQMTVERHFDFIRGNSYLAIFIINEINSNEKNSQVWRNIALPIFKNVIKTIDMMMKVEISKGTIRNIDAIDFILNIISLNIFVFAAQPILKGLKNVSEEEYEKFLDNRKKENVRLALLALQP